MVEGGLFNLAPFLFKGLVSMVYHETIIGVAKRVDVPLPAPGSVIDTTAD